MTAIGLLLILLIRNGMGSWRSGLGARRTGRKTNLQLMCLQSQRRPARMVIVDSSVLIDHLQDTRNPQTLWLRQYRSAQRVGITSLAFCEVLQGVRGQTRFLQVETELCQFEFFEIGSLALARAAA